MRDCEGLISSHLLQLREKARKPGPSASQQLQQLLSQFPADFTICSSNNLMTEMYLRGGQLFHLPLLRQQ